MYFNYTKVKEQLSEQDRKALFELIGNIRKMFLNPTTKLLIFYLTVGGVVNYASKNWETFMRSCWV